MKATIPGKISQGKFSPCSAKNWENALLSLEGKEVMVSISKRGKNRTPPQNSYLWGVVYKMISEETGDDPDSIHHHFTGLYLEEKGEVFPKVRSTTKLSTVEFNDYVDKILKFSAEFLSLYIPLPNENFMWGGL